MTSNYQAIVYFIVYSFLGWLIETLFYSIKNRKVVNAGFILSPFIITHGIIMVILISALPSFTDHRVLQFIYTVIITFVIDRLNNFIINHLTGIKWPLRRDIFDSPTKGFINTIFLSFVYFLLYQLLQPLLIYLFPISLLLIVKIFTYLIFILIIIDLIFSIIIVRKGKYQEVKLNSQSNRMALNLNKRLWKRLNKIYPGIKESQPESEDYKYIFGKGMSIDKLTWVFLISALLGDLIETIYVGLVHGEWMSRSSVLYGPFSFVWGIGAVVLTIVLSPLKDKSDRWVFLGGFFVGGAYEYLCSVFTELVFGTVFWDYSDMPLNINGRTNVLFMFFWGILTVIWVKNIYPAMSKAIEKIPPVTGKIITWIICVLMILNSLLTGMAMIRYNARQLDNTQYSLYDAFLDNQYPDDFMENRWPNMVVVEKGN